MDAQFVLKPSRKKVVTLNVMKVAFSVLIILGVVFYLSVLIDLSIFTEAFDVSSDELPSLASVIAIFIVAIIGTSMITAIISALSVGKKQIMFFADRLEVYDSFMGFSTNNQVIPYNNISNVNIDMNFGDHLIKTGTLIFGLTGMKKTLISFQFVENAGKYLPYIQKLMRDNMANYSADYGFNKRVSNNLDQY